MSKLFKAIWGGIKGALDFVLPSSTVARYLILGAILVLLAVVFMALVVLAWIGTGGETLPRGPEWLHTVWPVLMISLFIGMIVVAVYLYRLSGGDADSPFPDIDNAWREARRAMREAGIRFRERPLILVLGRPESAERNLFDSPGVNLELKQAPADPAAPLSVFADRKAVYLTCRGASLLGRLAAILALEELPDEAAYEELTAEQMEQTIRAGRRDQPVIDRIRATAGLATSTLERRETRRLLGKQLGPDFLAEAATVAELNDRLRYLCRLIGRDRQPWCPINGILLLLPLGSTDTAQEAQQAAQACQWDLAVIRAEMKLDCPVVALVVDMEDLPGFTEYMKRNPRELGRRLGQRFPMKTRLSSTEVLGHVTASIAWLCTHYLQESLYRDFELEKADNPEPATAFLPNARLFRLLDEMTRRSPALADIIKQAIVPEEGLLLRYAGCYLAGTGGTNETRGFVAGVLQRLIEEQNCVAWTSEAITQNSRDTSRAKGYIVAACCAIVLAMTAIVLKVVSHNDAKSAPPASSNKSERDHRP